MFEESLLERIRHVEANPGARIARNSSQGIGSIMNNLQKILNTRRGSVPIADDFGMPDFTNFPGEDVSDMARRLESMLKGGIEKYEPRLTNVRVAFEPKAEDNLSLRFKLEADMVRDRKTTVPVEFETVVLTNGQVKISR